MLFIQGSKALNSCQILSPTSHGPCSPLQRSFHQVHYKENSHPVYIFMIRRMNRNGALRQGWMSCKHCECFMTETAGFEKNLHSVYLWQLMRAYERLINKAPSVWRLARWNSTVCWTVARTLRSRKTSHTLEVRVYVVDNSGESWKEVLQRTGLVHGVMDSVTQNIWRCYLCRKAKIRIFKSLELPVLHYGCKTV